MDGSMMICKKHVPDALGLKDENPAQAYKQLPLNTRHNKRVPSLVEIRPIQCQCLVKNEKNNQPTTIFLLLVAYIFKVWHWLIACNCIALPLTSLLVVWLSAQHLLFLFLSEQKTVKENMKNSAKWHGWHCCHCHNKHYKWLVASSINVINALAGCF